MHLLSFSLLIIPSYSFRFILTALFHRYNASESFYKMFTICAVGVQGIIQLLLLNTHAHAQVCVRVSVYVCLYRGICVLGCLCIGVSVYRCVCVSVCLCIGMSVYRGVCVSGCLCIGVSVYRGVCVSRCLWIGVSVDRGVCGSGCLWIVVCVRACVRACALVCLCACARIHTHTCMHAIDTVSFNLWNAKYIK